MSQRAGFWIRTLAALIDAPVLVAVYFVSAWVFVIRLRTSDAERAGTIASAVLLTGWALYTTMEIWTAGTLGKLALRLRITRQDGTVAEGWCRFLRWFTKQYPVIFLALFDWTEQPLFRLVGGFGALFVVIGCLFASNDDHLAWHDQWAGTAVTRRQRTSAAGFDVVPKETERPANV